VKEKLGSTPPRKAAKSWAEGLPGLAGLQENRYINGNLGSHTIAY
jgi:hypothetical protein